MPDNSQMPEEEQEAESTASPSGGSGVVIPEEFQQRVHALVHKAPKIHLAHIRDRINQREDDLRKEEAEKMSKTSKKGGKNIPAEYSTAEMPS